MRSALAALALFGLLAAADPARAQMDWGSPDFVDTGQGFTGVSVRVLMNCCS